MMEKELYTREEVVEIFSAAVADRAKWFALFAKYTPKEIFPEIAKKVCHEFGYAKGKLCLPTKDSTLGMANFISSGFAIEAFGTKRELMSDEKSVLKWDKCPLIRGWKELGCTKEQIRDYCDLICNGDYGTAEACGIKCSFDELLSHGESSCTMVLTKK